MEAVNVKIGPLVFDHADYDPEGDVLYLHASAPQDAEGEETPEGHALRFEPATQRIVGLTVINARWLLDLHDRNPRLCRDFMARSDPGVDAVSGLILPLWEIPL
jgi:uncharacterized protein YuzE